MEGYMHREENETGKLLIYQNERGNTKIDVYFSEESVWMSQRVMANLYQVDLRTINEHISNIYSDGGLDVNRTLRNFRIVRFEGARQVNREIKHYNLEMILAVGYRVRSNVGIHFRNWATGVLTEYMKKGFVLNDERLKNPKAFGEDYFDELLERIRDIRASEKRVYQKVKDIFALSVDYDKRSETAQLFFKSVQNKLEYAATGKTAPEIIASRADASKENMGLTVFKGAKVRKGDVIVAKNYMSHEEISTLNLIVNMYLDYAELQARGHQVMHMADWEDRLNLFLQFNGRKVLQDLGSIKREVAEALAIAEYEKYDANRRQLEVDDVDELEENVKKLKS
jgi:hypothetical protein